MPNQEPAAGSQWSNTFAAASVDAMRAYDRVIARMFIPWAHDLVARLEPPVGCTALDIACGPGTVSHILAERIGPDGRVIATDISPAMLELARAKPTAESAAPIEWTESPAAPLPLADASVDALTCQEGLQFFPAKTEALAEMRRVLRPGGRAAVAVWTRVEEQVFVHMRDAVSHVYSPELAARYLGPFLLSGADAAQHARAAGFDNVELLRVELPAELPGGVADLFSTWPAAGIAADLAAGGEEQLAALRAELDRLAGPHEDDAGVLHGVNTASVLLLS